MNNKLLLPLHTIMSRIISIDYGTKRIGLAVTDPMKIIATGLDVVHPLNIIEFLKNYDKTENIELFVVGHAKTLKNEDSDSMKHIKPFVDKLKKEFPNKEIIMVDERFTSSMAHQSMLDSGMKKKNRQKKENADIISATIILQSYLNKKNYL